MAETNKTTTRKTKELVADEQPDVNKILAEKDKELSEMKTMMLQMQQQMQSMIMNQVPQQPQATEDFVNIYKSIPIVSMFDGQLNLTTLQHGQGKVYTFNKFGEMRNIVYNDLRDIITNNFNFAKDGYFYILDQKVVEENGLTDDYEKLITKEQIESIIDQDKTTIVDIFNTVNNVQKEVVVDIITRKLAKGEEFDLNKVEVISSIINKDIKEMAKDLKFALGEKL